tara:strand:- start:832 stop:1878 length:1047 start_codon:yes stop_codon:yes gene_type:complete
MSCEENLDNTNLLEGAMSLMNPVDFKENIFDQTDNDCSSYNGEYEAEVKDEGEGLSKTSQVKISFDETTCTIEANSIPNHNFNDQGSHFAHEAQAVIHVKTIKRNPEKASEVTPLSLEYDNGVYLNGVKLDLLAAACKGVGDEKVGCFDPSIPWRFDPMSEENNFGTDSHHAHVQPDGSYHYHASPSKIYNTSVEAPVIGFAADGFPIRGPYIKGEDGVLRLVKSSFKLKEGKRQPLEGEYENPGGTYTGQFRDDYEYVEDHGDLDECNGMDYNGTYSYFTTQSFPWVLACFKGTPDASFSKKSKANEGGETGSQGAKRVNSGGRKPPKRGGSGSQGSRGIGSDQKSP